MQKEQCGDCVVSSDHRIGLRSTSKPTFKSQRREERSCDRTPVCHWETVEILHVSCEESDLLASPRTNTKVGCERPETDDVHKAKDRPMRMRNQSRESDGTSTERYTSNKKQVEKEGRGTGDGSAQETGDDGQDVTICGGCQGYMDFFSEVFCVVLLFFFFLLYIFAHQETQRWKTLTKTERKNKLSIAFPNMERVKALATFRRATLPLQISRGPTRWTVQ